MAGGGFKPPGGADGNKVQQAKAAVWWPAADPARLRAAAGHWRKLVIVPDLDGLLVSPGKAGGLDLSLVESLGLTDLSVCSQVSSFGASAIAMVELAAYAVITGALPQAPRRWWRAL